ncbi:sn-glycerol-3-phosphate ABC transporter permease UgpE [Carnimonas bestiolae]|uniref:sn-glycerol-3-phosphate ABC transporter permease UgpE n=1 Tax=Carnimonas bestiolae TaxID=3402172 RepID=UPI003EDBF8E1
MRYNRPWLTLFSHAVLMIAVILFLFPVWMALMAATHSQTDLYTEIAPLWWGSEGFHNFIAVLTQPIPSVGTSATMLLTNSLVMSLGISLGKIAISLLAAYAVVFFDFRGKAVCFALIFITLMLPVEVRIVPTFQVVSDLHLLNTYPGMILPLIASATATFLFRQFFLTVPPELLEAARVDGAGPWAFLRDILLPLSKTNIAALFVIMFLYGWNQYLWPLLVSTDADGATLLVVLKKLTNAADTLVPWHLVMALAILAMLPPVAIIIALQRFFVKGLIDNEK